VSDEALMERVQNGDRRAFEVLYGRWKDTLIRFLVRRTGSRSHAEDALQETFIRVYRHRNRYKSARPFKPWVYRIAANAGSDARRPDARLTELKGPVVAQLSDPAATRDLLMSALNMLNAMDRRILLLIIEGFNTTEVGEILGMRSGAVRMRLNRARQKLQRELGDA
jgi:RNA polymerase sigma-70 factor (ECF subfamily)